MDILPPSPAFLSEIHCTLLNIFFGIFVKIMAPCSWFADKYDRQ